MTNEDLIKMLGLNDRMEKKTEVEDIQVDSLFGEESQEAMEISESVMKLTDWDYDQGKRLAAEASIESGDVTMADFFNMFYAQRPELAGQCHDGSRQKFVEAMMESGAYKALHQSTRAHRMAADMAAATASQEFCALVQDQEKNEEQREQRGDDDEPKTEDEKTDDAMGNLAAAHQAIDKAQEEVNDLNDALEAMGCGEENGDDGSMDTTKMSEMFKRIRNSRKLKEICELAGRFRRAARAKQRQKTRHGRDEMVGVTLGDQIDRLVPTELAMLSDEDFELDAMRRLVEKQSMVRDMKGSEKLGKGPIVVCVDESGSMRGDKIIAAKALALTMGWIARHQKRWLALVGFSSGKAKGTRLLLKPGKWDEAGLLDWLDHFYSGGTTMDIPFDVLPHEWWVEFDPPKGKTDIVMITDAIVLIRSEMAAKFKEWKQTNEVKMITLVVDANSAGDVEEVSDEVHLIKSIGLDAQGVQNCFEI